jgi:hypothetical protein
MALGDGIGNLSFNNISWYFDQLGVAFDNTLVMLFTKIKIPTTPTILRVQFPTAPVMNRVSAPTTPTYTRVP